MVKCQCKECRFAWEGSRNEKCPQCGVQPCVRKCINCGHEWACGHQEQSCPNCDKWDQNNKIIKENIISNY